MAVSGMVTPPQAPDWAGLYQRGDWSGIGQLLERERQINAAHQQNMGLSQMYQQQKQELHPLEVAGKKATNDYNVNLARESGLRADKHKAELDAMPPLIQRQAAEMSKLRSAQSEADQKVWDNEWQNFGRLIQVAESNGGRIPLEMQAQIPENYRAMISSPQGLKAAKQLWRAVALSDPKHVQQTALEGSRQAFQASEKAKDRTAAMDRVTTAAAARLAQQEAKLKNTPNDKLTPAQLRGTYMAQIADLNILLQSVDDEAKAATIQQQIQVKQAAIEESFQKEKELAVIRAQEANRGKVDLEAAAGIPTLGGNASGRRAGGPVDTAPANTPQKLTPNLPPEAVQAVSKWKAGDPPVTFRNGQQWIMENGQPKRVK